jgi:CheY-like chemotaxis protein
LTPSAVALNDLVRELEPLLRRLAGEDVEFVLELDEAALPALVDARSLEQVIVNLVVNARDAMASHGRITIQTGTATLDSSYGPLHGADVVPGTYDVLSVSDTGVGMDTATKARIFEPFFTTKEPGKGTGLGLSSVYGIVKQSGGYIWVYSEPGQGALFKVYLPRAPEEADAVSAPTSALIPEGAGRSILVVDDEPAVLDVIERTLTARGFDVLVARTPAAALAIASDTSRQIDALVTDVVMPGMSGGELASAIRAIRKIPVLLMSGYTGDATSRRGIPSEGTEILEKPFAATALATRIAGLMAAVGPPSDADTARSS